MHRAQVSHFMPGGEHSRELPVPGAKHGQQKYMDDLQLLCSKIELGDSAVLTAVPVAPGTIPALVQSLITRPEEGHPAISIHLAFVVEQPT